MKHLLIKFFDKLGYEVRRKQSVVAQIGFNPAYLQQLCRPKTVIDVGVGHGTFSLYNAYPKAHFILIEPLIDCRESIEKIAHQYDSEVHYVAVSDREGEMTFHVDTGNVQRSSFQQRSALTASGNPMEQRVVPVTTLDAIYAASHRTEAPILLKMDTEGHELYALRGATNLLQAVDTVIVEVSIARRFEDSYAFEDLIAFMKEAGFGVFSLLTLVHPHGELQPRFADVVFKRLG